MKGKFYSVCVRSVMMYGSEVTKGYEGEGHGLTGKSRENNGQVDVRSLEKLAKVKCEVVQQNEHSERFEILLFLKVRDFYNVSLGQQRQRQTHEDVEAVCRLGQKEVLHDVQRSEDKSEWRKGYRSNRPTQTSQQKNKYFKMISV